MKSLMIKAILIFTLCLGVLNGLETKELIKARYGVLQKDTILTEFKAARITFSIWVEDIFRQYDSDIEMVFYEDDEKAYKDFIVNESLDMVIVNLPMFFEHYDEIRAKSDSFWSIAYNEYKYKRYYLIARNEADMTSIKDVKNKVLTVQKKDSIAKVWIDKLALETFEQGIEKVTQQYIMQKEDSTAVLNVFFKTSDFAVISEMTWDTMVELNPAISKKLKIIEQSKPIHIPYIGFFSKKATPLNKEAFFELSADFQNLPRSSQIMTMLKFNRIFKVDEPAIAHLKTYFDDYFMLKQKYGEK